MNMQHLTRTIRFRQTLDTPRAMWMPKNFSVMDQLRLRTLILRLCNQGMSHACVCFEIMRWYDGSQITPAIADELERLRLPVPIIR